MATEKPNPFMAKAEATPAPKPKRQRRKRTEPEAAAEIEVEAICASIRSGAVPNDQLMKIAQAINDRREELKAMLAEQVKAVYGDEYEVTRPGDASPAASPRARPGGPLQPQGDKHPNEVELTGFAAEGLPDLSMGYGSPSIADTGGGSGVATATDVMQQGSIGESEIVTTGAQIG